MTAIVIFCLIAVVLFLAYSQFSKNDSAPTGSNAGGSSSSPVSTFEKGGVNNPGFLVHTPVSWLGKIKSEGCTFENFASLKYGIRAWYVNLFRKMQKGIITNRVQMIDVLTPAGSDNPEVARNNYKAYVSQANSWVQLGQRVFDFEANPSWKCCSNVEKAQAIQEGLKMAVDYSYKGNTPALLPNG